MQKWIFALLILLIVIRFIGDQPVYKDGDYIRVSGTVTSESIVYDTSQYLRLLGVGVYLPKYPDIVYGDEVVVEGWITDGKIKKGELKKLTRETKGLFTIRSKLIHFYKNSIPEPHSSLIAGTVLGSKQMPESFWNTLRETGTAHVVVASGTNVTLVASFLIGVSTYFLRRKYAIYFTLAGISLYIIISGFDAPLVRAGIMGTIAFLAQEKGKLINAARLLVYSALIMLLLKPAWITDLGFILSFVATISLMLFQKKVNQRLKYLPLFLKEGLSTSIAAQIGVAPIIFATFGQFNILSPIINALILWTIPYIMIIGAISGLVGIVIPSLGSIMLYLAYPLTWWFVTIVYLF